MLPFACNTPFCGGIYRVYTYTNVSRRHCHRCRRQRTHNIFSEMINTYNFLIKCYCKFCFWPFLRTKMIHTHTLSLSLPHEPIEHRVFFVPTFLMWIYVCVAWMLLCFFKESFWWERFFVCSSTFCHFINAWTNSFVWCVYNVLNFL